MTEISRGLRSGRRDDTPGERPRGFCILKGCQRSENLRAQSHLWHPSGVQAICGRLPGVSLRSTPGKFLPALQAGNGATGEIVRLSHPRRDVRAEHFAWQAERIEGRTPMGRATARMGSLTQEQESELDNYMHLGWFLDLMKSKARLSLGERAVVRGRPLPMPSTKSAL